jgi:glycosyltransferase involved in cell wall biosynthesis
LTEEEKEMWKDVSKISVIPNPLPFLPEKKASLNNKKVIAVGRLAYEKGFDLLIEAWEIVNKSYPDWELNIFGFGPEKDRLRQLIDRKNLNNTIKINDPVSGIHKQYIEHSMIIFTSRYLEALPMVLIEAMSCGLPIVSFDAPCGPKDIISDGNNGFLVKTGDIQSLADKICQLMESDNLRKTMGENGKIMSENYRVEKIIAQWIELFRKLQK